jgi:RHS repeat-associated protein
MTKIALVFYGFWCSQAETKAQSQVFIEDLELNQNIPPIPNKASLSGALESQVILSTGKMVTSIPLVELISKNLPLCIHLTYTGGSGIMVNDLASEVGLGWILEEEAFIERQVKGLPDEEYQGSFGNNLVGIEKTGQPDHKFKFLGKEHQPELGLNWHHLDARFYDPALGRFHSIDPLIELYQESWTPYHYSFNNPIRFGDPDGRWPGEGLWKGFKNWINQSIGPQAQNIGRAYMMASTGADTTPKTRGELILAVAGQVGNSFQSAPGRLKMSGLRSTPATRATSNVAAHTTPEAPQPATLVERAHTVQNAQPSQKGRNMSTTATAQLQREDGTTYVGVSSSKPALTREQRAALQPGEVEIKGKGHAEVTVVNHANANGEKVVDMAVSRPTCDNCAQYMYDNGLQPPLTPLKHPDTPEGNPWMAPFMQKQP